MADGAAFQQAYARHLAGDAAAAERGYRRALAGDPAHVDALNLLGLATRDLGDAAGGARWLDRATRLAPWFAHAWANLSRTLAGAGRAVEAARAAGMALILAPDLPGARLARVTLLVRVGDMANARGDAAAAKALHAAAARLDGGDEAALDRKMRMSAADDMLGAIDAAERLWSIRSDDTRRDNLWNLCVKAGADVGSARTREWLAAGRQGSPAAWIAHGNALREETYGQGAEIAYKIAAALRPGEPFAYARLACLYVQQARYRQADAAAQRVAARWRGREQAMRFDGDFILAAAAEWRKNGGFTPHSVLSASDKPVLVLAGCDGVYFQRFASALLRSTVENAGIDASFHLHVVNPPPDAARIVADWNARLGGPGVGLTTETVDAAALGDEAKTAYACARFRLLPWLLRQRRRRVLMLDADLIVLRRLTALLESTAEADVAMVGGAHNRFEPWNLHWADVVAINPTEAAVAYFDRVAAYIDYFLRRGLSRWFLDQIALTAVAACGFPDRPPPRIVHLPKDIHRMAIRYADGVDEEPDRGCLFWSAHASTVSTRLTLNTPRYRRYLL